MPQGFSRFGGGGETFLTPAALVVVVVAILLILTLPRKYIAIPLITSALLIPLSQVVIIAGLHFMMLRIIVVFGWARVGIVRLVTGRRAIDWTSLDTAFVAWALVSSVAFWLLWGGSTAALINRFGFLW